MEEAFSVRGSCPKYWTLIAFSGVQSGFCPKRRLPNETTKNYAIDGRFISIFKKMKFCGFCPKVFIYSWTMFIFFRNKSRDAAILGACPVRETDWADVYFRMTLIYTYTNYVYEKLLLLLQNLDSRITGAIVPIYKRCTSSFSNWKFSENLGDAMVINPKSKMGPRNVPMLSKYDYKRSSSWTSRWCFFSP